MRKLNEEKHENDSTLVPCILPQVYKLNLTCEDLKYVFIVKQYRGKSCNYLRECRKI